MPNGKISLSRVLERLDLYLSQNDYAAAERHLAYWMQEAYALHDEGGALALLNEQMGLFRKLGDWERATQKAAEALSLVAEMGVEAQAAAATTYINAATVYKAFDRAPDALPLFEKARAVYEATLEPNDKRLGALYNNMGLALVDLKRYSEAETLYRKAIAVMTAARDAEGEIAITYLNIATAVEARMGLLDGDVLIADCLDKAETFLEAVTERNGHYAFVCEKCASVFEYYGRFAFAEMLAARARRIYEGT